LAQDSSFGSDQYKTIGNAISAYLWSWIISYVWVNDRESPFDMNVLPRCFRHWIGHYRLQKRIQWNLNRIPDEDEIPQFSLDDLCRRCWLRFTSRKLEWGKQKSTKSSLSWILQTCMKFEMIDKSEFWRVCIATLDCNEEIETCPYKIYSQDIYIYSIVITAIIDAKSVKHEISNISRFSRSSYNICCDNNIQIISN
jgi:hypothetical protein